MVFKFTNSAVTTYGAVICHCWFWPPLLGHCSMVAPLFIATIFSWFGILSVLLTATALFALVSLTTLKKMKEIALRRVAGAAPRHILVLTIKVSSSSSLSLHCWVALPG